MKTHTWKIGNHKGRAKPYQLQISGKSCGYYQTREEAERIRDKVFAELGVSKVEKPTAKPTLMSIADAYLVARQSLGYKVSHESIVKNWILPHDIAKKPLQEIKAEDIQQFVNWLEKQKRLPGHFQKSSSETMSMQTVKNIKNVLSAHPRAPTNPFMSRAQVKGETHVSVSPVFNQPTFPHLHQPLPCYPEKPTQTPRALPKPRALDPSNQDLPNP